MMLEIQQIPSSQHIFTTDTGPRVRGPRVRGQLGRVQHDHAISGGREVVINRYLYVGWICGVPGMRGRRCSAGPTYILRACWQQAGGFQRATWSACRWRASSRIAVGAEFQGAFGSKVKAAAASIVTPEIPALMLFERLPRLRRQQGCNFLSSHPGPICLLG